MPEPAAIEAGDTAFVTAVEQTVPAIMRLFVLKPGWTDFALAVYLSRSEAVLDASVALQPAHPEGETLTPYLRRRDAEIPARRRAADVGLYAVGFRRNPGQIRTRVRRYLGRFRAGAGLA